MYKILVLVALTALFFSCSPDKSGKKANISAEIQPEAASPEPSVSTKVADVTFNPRTQGGAKAPAQLAIEAAQQKMNSSVNRLLGYWVGQFGPNKINITLAHIEGEEVQGYSVCAGNYRPISGSVVNNGDNRYTFSLKEPGDNRYDGKFDFTIDLNKQTLSGKWIPYQKEGVTTTQYTLQKKNFRYNSNVGKWPESSLRRLTAEELENYSSEELALMRNEIYARHGYCFKNKDFRQYFEQQDWYMPMGVDIREKLTDTEVQNIELIYEYESYYEEYYDSYGR